MKANYIHKMILKDCEIMLDWNFKEIPKPYGWFHLLWLGIAFISILIFFKFAEKSNDKKDSFVVFISCLFLLFTEIFKQLFKYYELGQKYNWSTFPFQLCSIPMYLGTISILIKNKNIKETIYRYISFTGIAGGITILLHPVISLSLSIIMCIHSFLWHTILVSLGVYLIHSRDYGKNIFKETFGPSVILLIVIIMAIGTYNNAYYSPLLRQYLKNIQKQEKCLDKSRLQN